MFSDTAEGTQYGVKYYEQYPITTLGGLSDEELAGFFKKVFGGGEKKKAKKAIKKQFEQQEQLYQERQKVSDTKIAVAQARAKRLEAQVKALQLEEADKPAILKVIEAIPTWGYYVVGGAFGLLLVMSILKKKKVKHGG